MGQSVEVAAGGTAEHGHQHRLRKPRDLADCPDPTVVELVGGDRPDTPEPLDRERVQEGELAIGRHHEQAVGLGDAARNLGEELRPRHPDRNREADPFADVAPQALGDLDRGPDSLRIPRTSRNASSIERPSTSGLASSNTRNIALLASV